MIEVTKYAWNHKLPITFVEEDNGLSTDTPTQEVWGSEEGGKCGYKYIKYQRKFPHYGCGVFVDFDEALKQEGGKF